MADKSGSVLTGHHEHATGEDDTGKKVDGWGSTQDEAIENCREAGSTTEPQLKK
jgi:hypothetical protein